MLKYASGRYEICLPNIVVQTGTVSSAPGTYYIWAQARNDIGYNLPVGPFAITLGANQGISISWSSECYKNGESWRRLALSVSTTSTASDALVFCEVDVVSTSLANSSSIIEPYFLANPSPLASAVPDDYVDGNSNAAYGRGVIFQYSDGNYYRYNKLSSVTYPPSLPSSKGGQWVRSYYPARSIYIEDTSDPNLGCDVEIKDILDPQMVLPLTYAANGADGPTRYFALYNSGSTSYIGTTFNMKVELLGEDVSVNFKGLLKITNFFVASKLTGLRISTPNGLNYYDVTRPVNFTLPQAYEETVISVTPNFTYEQLIGLPVGSFTTADLTFTPFLSKVQSTFDSELSSFLGDNLVMPYGGKIRLHPTTSGYKYLSGKYSQGGAFYVTNEGIVTTSSIGVSVFGFILGGPYSGPSNSGIGAYRQRASITRGSASSQVSSFSNGIQAGASPILNVTLNHPSTYRTSYPDVLAGTEWLGKFIVSSMTLYVKKVSTNDINAAGDIFTFNISGFNYSVGDSLTQIATVDLSTPTSTLATNSYITAPFFPEAGLYSPPTPSAAAAISGTGFYYFVACQYNWVNQITGITHNIDLKEVFITDPGESYQPFKQEVNGSYTYTTLPGLTPQADEQFKTKVVVNPKGYPELWTFTGTSFPSTPYIDNLGSGKWYRLGSEIGFFSEGTETGFGVTPSFDREMYYDLVRKEILYNSEKTTKNWLPAFNSDSILTYNGEVLVDPEGNVLRT